MGQLCAKPRTKDEKPAASLTAQSRPCAEHDSPFPAVKGRPEELQAQHILPASQPSDAASSELDVVVQHLRETNYSVTGSAPELLQQWDHDHRVVLDSIEAAIQRTQNHRQSLESSPTHHGIPAAHHDIPAVYVHTTQPHSKLGPAQHHAPPPPVQAAAPQQGIALQDEPLLHQAKQAYADGRLLQAHKRLQELSDARGIDYLKSNNHFPEIGPDLAGLDALKDSIDKGLYDLKNHEGWTVARDDDLQVMYRHQAGTSIHSFKFSADFNSPLEHVLAMSREFDLTHIWNRYVLDSIILTEPSIFESTLYATSWLPFPFPHIDVVVQARGIDLADEDRCLLILMHTPEDMAPLQDLLPASAAKRKHADVKPGSCIRLQPLPPLPNGQERVRASVITHMDPHIKHVPAMLLNFIMKVMSPFIFSTIQKVLKTEFSSPDKVLPTRMREKPDLYGLIRPRIAEYVHRLQQEDDASL